MLFRSVRNSGARDEEDRWINVWWDEEILDHKLNQFSTGLQISTRSRIGVLSDVAILFAQAHVNVHELSARDLNDGFGVINAMIDVSGVSQLDNIINRIKNTKGVLDVIRMADGV